MEELLSRIGISAATMTPTVIVFDIVLPIIAITYAISLFIQKFFKRFGTWASTAIGAVMAILFVLNFRIGMFGFWFGLAGVLIFKLKNWPERLISLVILGIIVLQVGAMKTLPSITAIYTIGLLFAALVAFLKIEHLYVKIIAVIAIIVIYFVALPYVAKITI